MKTSFKIFGLIALTAMVACGPVKVVVDKDDSVDFSKYETYSFMGWQEDSDKLLSEFDKRRIRDAFKAEFDARKLTYVEEGGDLDISLFLSLDQKTSVSSYTDYYGSGYGRRYSGWGMGSSTTTYNEYEYTESTLVMDVFDSGSRKQVWQAIATGTVDVKPEKRERNIPRGINALMNEFPVETVES